jgi:hypothetical protein
MQRCIPCSQFDVGSRWPRAASEKQVHDLPKQQNATGSARDFQLDLDYQPQPEDGQDDDGRSKLQNARGSEGISQVFLCASLKKGVNKNWISLGGSV